ncbi:ICE-like protease (caspase) p20 domain protein [Rhizoctonia solani]|uniref:ICE-like protease (Caspase) p20 domain protein n=1 Tax=Rhizoctonia solani TaxID=456999 RepID=A0A8H8NTY5_9AGAM|nr:ICE-like protease (caspase) p20 domain protein [Rhizoctonia solani]QRW19849.1 ICE-like protease (caspase) p20 domain protein [Rhizoctonia solani]
MGIAGESPRSFKQINQIVSQSSVPNLHALLIGIDTYTTVTPLSGAVNDAHQVELFLRFGLEVPQKQINVLKNEQATRSGILGAIKALRRNPAIKLFDPILIYYAGHGCEVKSPLVEPGNPEGKTECLVPRDVCKGETGRKEIPLIPDYTIAALLDELAAEKGNNITVILDCCHSASSTRGIHLETSAKLDLKIAGFSQILQLLSVPQRSLSPDELPPLTRDTDKEIFQVYKEIVSNGRWIKLMAAFYLCHSRLNSDEREGSSVKSRASLPSVNQLVADHLRPGRSHVLLAACGHTERAYEDPKTKKGIFTDALLRLLKSRPITELTYKAIFENFPNLSISGTKVNQNPVCEGANATRMFLRAPILGQRCSYISMTGLGSKYTYDDVSWLRPIDYSTCKTFIAHTCTESPRVSPLRSWCELNPDAEAPAQLCARLVERGSFHSFQVTLSDELRMRHGRLAKELEEKFQAKKQGIHLVESSHRSISDVVVDIQVDESDGEWITFTLSSLSTSLPFRCRLDAMRIYNILFSMAQWNWHLNRVPHRIFKPTKELAELTVYKVDSFGLNKLPIKDGSISIPASSGCRFAFKIRSFHNKHLYAYLFYFSTASQSIRPLYLRVYGSGHVDPHIEPRGKLTIGYSNNDMISGPISFRNTPDVGYLRLFLTSSPGDFDSMTQASPFLPRMMYTASTQIKNGGEYLDGVEINKLATSSHRLDDQVRSEHPDIAANSSIDLQAEEHSTSLDTISKPILGSSRSSPQLAQEGELFNIKQRSSRVCLSRIQTIEKLQENPAWMEKQLWDMISLKVSICA